MSFKERNYGSVGREREIESVCLREKERAIMHKNGDQNIGLLWTLREISEKYVRERERERECVCLRDKERAIMHKNGVQNIGLLWTLREIPEKYVL
jgi:hypothetical protein